MSLIANLVVGMAVKTGKFTSGLKSAGSSVGKFQQEAMSLKGAILGLGAAFGAGVLVNSLKNIVDAQIGAISSTGRMAKRLNASTKSFTALQFAASSTGIEVDEFGDALSDMVEKLGDARAGGGDAGEVMKTLGLDLNEMSRLDPTKAFTRIAEEISKLDNQADKLTLADKMFGGAGQKLIPLLDQGAAGIENLQKEAERLGISFSQVDANQVAMASQSLNRISGISQGLKQKLTIGLAPIITTVANKFTDMATSGFNTGKFITSGIEIAVKAIGMAADVVHTLKLGFKLLQAGVTAALGWFVKGWALTGQAIEKVVNMLPGVEVSFTDTITAIGDDLIKLSKNQYGEFQSELMKEPPSTGIKNFFNELKTESAAAAQAMAESAKQGSSSFNDEMTKANRGTGDLITKLKEQIATFGMVGNAVEIWKLKQDGASDEMIKKAEKLNKTLEDLADDKKLSDFGKSLTESFLTPLQKYEKELAKLQEAKSKGFIDDSVYQQAVEKAKQALDKTGGKVQLSGAVDYGSKEAYSIVNRSRMAGQQPINKVEKNTKETLKEQKISNEHLSKMADSKPQIFTLSPA